MEQRINPKHILDIRRDLCRRYRFKSEITMEQLCNIAKNIGYSVMQVTFRDNSSIGEIISSRKVITISKTQPYSKQRIYLAHYIMLIMLREKWGYI